MLTGTLFACLVAMATSTVSMAAPTAHDAAMRHAAKREGYDGLEWCGVGKRCPRAEFAYSCAGRLACAEDGLWHDMHYYDVGIQAGFTNPLSRTHMVYDPVGSKHWSNCLVVTLHKWKKGVTKPGDLEPVCTLMKHGIGGKVHDYIDLKFAKDREGNVKMPADFRKGDYDLLDYHFAGRGERCPPESECTRAQVDEVLQDFSAGVAAEEEERREAADKKKKQEEAEKKAKKADQGKS